MDDSGNECIEYVYLSFEWSAFYKTWNIACKTQWPLLLDVKYNVLRKSLRGALSFSIEIWLKLFLQFWKNVIYSYEYSGNYLSRFSEQLYLNELMKHKKLITFSILKTLTFYPNRSLHDCDRYGVVVMQIVLKLLCIMCIDYDIIPSYCWNKVFLLIRQNLYSYSLEVLFVQFIIG